MDCDDGTTSNSTSDDRLFDLDIYSDLITTENDQPLTEITKQYEDLLKECEELRQSNANLEKQNKTLLENISKLYKTAKFELYQKNLKLKGMKEHLDAVIFRRMSKHGNYSATARNKSKNFTFDANKSCNDDKINFNVEKSEPKSVNNFNRTRQNIISQEDTSGKVLSSSSKMLLQYYQDQNSSKRKKPQKRKADVSDNNSKTGGNRNTEENCRKSLEKSVESSRESCKIASRTNIRDKYVKKLAQNNRNVIENVSGLRNNEGIRRENYVDTKRPQFSKFNHHKSEVVKKAEAIKRRIRKSSISPRKNYENKCFSPNPKKAKKRNEIEDGEILSDSEETLKIKERNDSSRKVRKFDIDEKNVANERNGYLHQLEMNRIKMKIRREKVLLSKAREEMNSNEKKYR